MAGPGATALGKPWNSTTGYCGPRNLYQLKLIHGLEAEGDARAP